MKRRLCSHDMVVVPGDPFVLDDGVGDIYFCNARCFCVWAVEFATKPNLPGERRAGTFVMTTPTGEMRRFGNVVEVAQWAAANAIGSESAEWLRNGEKIEAASEGVAQVKV